MKSVADVVAVQVVGRYRVKLTFEDGLAGETDLADELVGPIFDAVRNETVFAQVKVDPEIGTIVWPNGADTAPETLYHLVAQGSVASAS